MIQYKSEFIIICYLNIKILRAKFQKEEEEWFPAKYKIARKRLF